MKTKENVNSLVYEVIGAAIEVQKEMGPGLLESVYHKCMEQELTIRKLNFTSELKIPVSYKGRALETELRCDFCIENCLIVEIKSVQALLPVFDAQVLTYMKLLKAPKGLILNFNAADIYYHGQKTLVNEYYKSLIDK